MLENAVYAIGSDCQSEQDCAQQLLNRLQRAINQRNWPLFSSCFTEQVVLVNLLGQRLTGAAELTRYQQQLIEMHQDRVWVYQLLHLQQLDLDTFLINAEQHWQRTQQGSALQHKVGLCSTPLYVVKRQGSQWRICAGNTL
jgi:ketosteroid isomerase-like protein